MSNLVLVTPEGEVVTIEKHTTPTPEVEEQHEDPLYVIAARQHAKDSTKKDTNNERIEFHRNTNRERG